VAQPPRTEAPPAHRTLRSDLDRLRDRVPPLVLVGAAALIIVVIVVAAVLATRGGDGGEEAGVEPTSPPAAVEPEAQPPGEEPVAEPPAAAPTLSVPEDVTLQEGDEGQNVTTLQQALAQLGFLSEEPDGIFGEQTRVAVEGFQQSAGLEVDGVVGPGTAAAINEALAGAG
jgi:peptidoglycan hydrolase-like protein with peptidoglycan-binding domain